MDRIRIQIVDDQAIFRLGLRRLLESDSGFDVVAESGTVAAAIGDALLRNPDVILLDLKLGKESGLTVAETLKEKEVKAKILVLSAYDDFPLIEAAIAVGVTGYLLKEASQEELSRAIRMVNAGNYFLHDNLAASMMQGLRFRSTPVNPFTTEEQDLLRLLASGLSYVEIAKHTYLNERTVRRHAQALYEKLGVQERVQAVALATKNGWL